MTSGGVVRRRIPSISSANSVLAASAVSEVSAVGKNMLVRSPPTPSEIENHVSLHIIGRSVFRIRRNRCRSLIMCVILVEQRGEDLTLDLYVTLKDLYLGKDIEVSAKGQVLCPHCRGTGAENEEGIKTCNNCDGKGVVLSKENSITTTFSCCVQHFRCYIRTVRHMK